MAYSVRSVFCGKAFDIVVLTLSALLGVVSMSDKTISEGATLRRTGIGKLFISLTSLQRRAGGRDAHDLSPMILYKAHRALLTILRKAQWIKR